MNRFFSWEFFTTLGVIAPVLSILYLIYAWARSFLGSRSDREAARRGAKEHKQRRAMMADIQRRAEAELRRMTERASAGQLVKRESGQLALDGSRIRMERGRLVLSMPTPTRQRIVLDQANISHLLEERELLQRLLTDETSFRMLLQHPQALRTIRELMERMAAVA